MDPRIKRLWQSARLTLLPKSRKRAYSERHRIFGLYGDNVTFQPKAIPLYPQLIRLHDNVVIGRGVEFVTHDVIHVALNGANVIGAGCPKTNLS